MYLCSSRRRKKLLIQRQEEKDLKIKRLLVLLGTSYFPQISSTFSKHWGPDKLEVVAFTKQS